MRKKLEASKNPPESRNNRKALIAARAEARKSAKKDPAVEERRRPVSINTKDWTTAFEQGLQDREAEIV